jgi:hypothetical protein
MKPEQREQKIRNESTHKPTRNISKQRINTTSTKVVNSALFPSNKISRNQLWVPV